MAEVLLEIAGRAYPVACRDGEEEHLLGLGKLVDAKAQDAGRAMGSMTENRHLLVTALLLADAINDKPTATIGLTAASPADDSEIAFAIERLAERMERLAAMLETGGANP
ncbi:MAG: cell division protein ZapA [Sphingomonadaceae bacterium]